MTGTCRKIGFTSTLLAALLLAPIASATPTPQPDPPDPNPTVVTSEVVTNCDNVAGVADYQVCYAIIEFKFSIDDHGDVDIGVASITTEDCGDFKYNVTGGITANAAIATYRNFTAHTTIAPEVANLTDTGTIDPALIVTMQSALMTDPLSQVSGMKENIAGTFARVTRAGLVSVTGDANAKKGACT